MRHSEPDPTEEYFDVVDRNGAPTGRVKRRSEVHQDGDWHCAFHCWVALIDENGAPAILFQRRSPGKDTYPDKLDVAVGGHYRAGEGFDEVVREIEEELGFAPINETLINVGRRWAEGVTARWIDREIEDVYVHCLAVPVSALSPSFEEITALDVIEASDIESIFGGEVDIVSSRRFRVRPDNTLDPPVVANVSIEDFIPVTDCYWPAGSRAAAEVLHGRKNVRLTLR